MNYQRILIILLVIFALWYLFFRRYEPLTIPRRRGRRPRVARLRRRKRHYVFDERGGKGFVSGPPMSTTKINCVQIKCPEEFDDDVVCWKCHEER